jgi:hypothetical protein
MMRWGFPDDEENFLDNVTFISNLPSSTLTAGKCRETTETIRKGVCLPLGSYSLIFRVCQ